MPTDLIFTAKGLSDQEKRKILLEKLRSEYNPFDNSVVRTSVSEQSLELTVPEYNASQMADLTEIIEKYRSGTQGTQGIPIIGQVGAGKTQLLYQLRDHLRNKALQEGQETLFIIVPRLTEGIDALNFLLFLVANHLLEKNADSTRLRNKIAEEITKRVLRETLNSLPDAKKVELFPTTGGGGLFNPFKRFGGQNNVQDRLKRIGQISELCNDPRTSIEQIRQACATNQFDLKDIFEIIQKYLEKNEPRTPTGLIRQKLFSGFIELALFQNQDNLQSVILNEETNTPNQQLTARNILMVCLETFRELKIPVCVVFDQLEDYFVGGTPEQTREKSYYFGNTLTTIINELPNVCLLLFMEEGVWNELANRLPEQMRMRLQLPFSLKGRPSITRINLPSSVSEQVVLKLIRNGVKRIVPEITGWDIPLEFPFSREDVAQLQNSAATIRFIMRKLADRYNQIVYVAPPPPRDLYASFKQIWENTLTLVSKDFGADPDFAGSEIPTFHNALHQWLSKIHERKIDGTQNWKKVELYHNENKNQYGYLNLIRFQDPNPISLGIAFWMGRRTGQANDLKNRIELFQDTQCGMNKLILLRSDGLAAISKGKSKEVYDEAQSKGYDIQIHQYDTPTLYKILAFDKFFSEAWKEYESCQDSEKQAMEILQRFLKEISEPILKMISEWQKPTNKPSGD